MLLGEGVDPHLYKPTRADTAKMLKADMVVANGLDLEAQFRDTFEQLAKTKPVVLAGEKLPKDRLLADEDYKDKPDPHVSVDPSVDRRRHRGARRARAPPSRRKGDVRPGPRCVCGGASRPCRLRKTSARIDPEREAYPSHRPRRLSYFARAYEMEVIGIQGVSTESEAGLKKIEEVVALVIERGIPAIFVESSVSDRNVKAVVEGAARRGHKLEIGAELFSDAMGAPGTYEGTYLGMIDHNVTTITRALGGQAPARGLKGRLGAAG